MSDTAALLLILAGLHAMESCLVVPHGTVVFRPDLIGRFVAVRASALLHVSRGRFVFLNPLNPRARLVVAGLPHILPTAEGVLDVAPEEDNALRRRPFVPWSAIGPARATESSLACAGLGAIPCGSPRAARLWARLINALRTAPPQRRARLLERWQRLRFSTAIIRRRAARVRTACATLEYVSTFSFLLVVAGGAVAVQRHSTWIILGFLGTGVLAGLVMAACYWVAHARLHPRAWGDRLGRALMMGACFPIAFRARATLGRDALGHAHPAAVAAVLVPPRRVRVLLADMSRRWTHRAAPPQAGSIDAQQLDHAARQMLSLLAATARELKIDRADLEASPRLDDPAVHAWCPRCHATYVHAGGMCSDCPGVALLAVKR